MKTIRCKNTYGDGTVEYVEYQVEEYIDEEEQTVPYTDEQLHNMSKEELAELIRHMQNEVSE